MDLNVPSYSGWFLSSKVIRNVDTSCSVLLHCPTGKSSLERESV